MWHINSKSLFLRCSWSALVSIKFCGTTRHFCGCSCLHQTHNQYGPLQVWYRENQKIQILSLYWYIFNYLIVSVPYPLFQLSFHFIKNFTASFLKRYNICCSLSCKSQPSCLFTASENISYTISILPKCFITNHCGYWFSLIIFLISKSVSYIILYVYLYLFTFYFDSIMGCPTVTYLLHRNVTNIKYYLIIINIRIFI